MFTLDQARSRFEERFPEFQNKARAYFADYKPEAKDRAPRLALGGHRGHARVVSRNHAPSRPRPGARLECMDLASTPRNADVVPRLDAEERRCCTRSPSAPL